MKDKLLPCPFCNEIPEIVVEDDEGNVHLEAEYEKNPWSGLWYAIKHISTKPNCFISDTYAEQIEYSRDIGGTAWSSRKEAIDFWNTEIKKVKNKK